MSHNKKTITIITVVVLVLALVIGWCAWRKHVTSTKETQASANTSSSSSTNKAKKKKTPVLSDKQKEQNKTIALQMEKDMRNWGVDSLADPHQWDKQSADQVLSALRTPDLPDFPDSGIVGFDVDPSWGKNAISYVCSQDNAIIYAYCSIMPDNQTWWKSEVWGTGTRWVDEPKSTAYNDGKVRVKGTVRAILVTNGDTYSLGGYKAVTPAWRDYAINDLLTIKDGKVSWIEHDADEYWWLNPYFNEWTPDNVAKNIGGGNRIAIPVQGDLNWNGLNQTGITKVLRHPESEGDLLGKVDWSMWEDISFTSNPGCQNCPANGQ
ncbi:hypothetical protein [Bifidobacterium adolescentis]|uniref:hypothetical protein n=1 Tax=Bifidobacterium adolescentis TaxID=1680 RepID=UPI003BB775A7